MLKAYNVFNIEQTTIEPPEPAHKKNPIQQAEEIFNNIPNKPKVEHQDKLGAYYQDKDDVINLPGMNLFDSVEFYYSALFHELIHWTGHQSRLNREMLSNYFVSQEERAKEELVAEIGASYLCAHCGIENFVLDNSTSYISSWSKALKDNKKIFVTLANQAQKAVEFILNDSNVNDSNVNGTNGKNAFNSQSDLSIFSPIYQGNQEKSV